LFLGVSESSPTSRYKVNYYKYRNQNMVWNVRRICNVYSNIVNINVKNEMYFCEIFLIMYKKENCVCKGLTFLFICVVIDLVPARGWTFYHVCINVYTFYNHRLYYDIYIEIYRFIVIDYSMFVYVNNVSVLYKSCYQYVGLQNHSTTLKANASMKYLYL
jgi:hypothetical protein